MQAESKTVIEILLQFDANPNLHENKDVGENTPLHLCSEKGLLDIMDMFLAFGGDPTCKNKAGQTCLHIAARNGDKEMVKLLLEKGNVDPDIRDGFGFSASYWAKANKHQEICEMLPKPLKVTKEDLYSHILTVWEKHGFEPGKKKKKKGKKKK